MTEWARCTYGVPGFELRDCNVIRTSDRCACIICLNGMDITRIDDAKSSVGGEIRA